MTIILFLVDTSSSMCQKAYVNGVQKTYLDIAKGAVETFLKYRQRTQDCLGDRYMLLTFEEPPANVKAGWKENHATFMNELKNLQSHGLTSMGESLRNAFDLLNLNRMQSGIDTYGQGRCPFYLEPSVIIVITDGGRYSYRNGVHQEIILPLSNQIPGTKFTKEPFRWDQRLFSLVLRMPGNKIDERVDGKVPHDDSPIERMCEVTGGRSYRVRSHYVLNQCIESLVQKVQPGVVLQFEPMVPKDSSSSTATSSSTVGGSGSANASGNNSNSGNGSGSNASTSSNSSSSTTTTTTATTSSSTEPTPDIVFPPMKKMIYVQKHITQKTFPIGYWPLPEPYWPDSKAITLPPRDAHPKLKILTPAVDEPQLVRSFPVDKYEIEGCPLTLQILNKREMNKCWQVIVTNGMHGFELPFGYVRAAPNFSQVHLYVLAYNYPALLPLLHDLIHKYNMSPPNDLMYKFNAYVRSIPPYYCPFLRKALVNINVPYQLLQFLLPENVDNYLSPTIANQLKHIKNTAKQDQENLCLKVYKQLKQPKPPYRQVETAKLCTGAVLRRDLVRHPLLRDTFAKLHAEIEPVDNYTIVVPQLVHQSSAKTYRNPFDIPRRDLVDEIARMRESFLRPSSLVAKDSGHCLPIAEMGNYQEYLKNKDNPLREIEPTNVRQHMFGNPYKKDKHMVMVDEADLSDVAPMKSSNSNNGGNNSPSSSGGGVGGISSMSLVGGGMSNLMLGGGSHGGSGIGGPMGMSSKSKLLDGTTRGRKRKAGPLPRAFEFRRASTDSRRSGSISPTPSTSSNISNSSSIASIASSSISIDVDMLLDDDSNSSFASDISNDSNSSSGSSSTSSSIISNVSSSSSNMSTSSNISSSSTNIAAGSSIVAAIAAATAAANNNNISSSSGDSGLSLHSGERGVSSSSNSFDFNEEEACEPVMSVNGYVHNFINGISEEERANEAEINIASSSSSNSVNNTSASNNNSNTPAATATAAGAATTTAPEAMTATTTAITTTASSSIIVATAATPTASAATVASNGASDPYSSSSISYHNHNHNHLHHLHQHHHNHHSSSGVLYVPVNGPTMQHAAYSSNVGATLDNTMLLLPPTTATAMHKVASASAMSPLLLLPNGYASHHGGMLSPPAAAATSIAVAATTIAAAAGTTTATATTTNSSSATTTTTPLTTTTSSSSTTSAYFSHNDINDASEISRILQTCHNGNSGSSNSSNTISINSSGSNTLNGNANDANGHDLDSDMEMGNSFDALKRTVSGSSPSTVGSSPHFYWGSGLNHSSSSISNISNNSNSNTNNSNNSNNISSNQHRSLNNSSPKLETKASPTHSNHSNSSNNSNNSNNNNNNADSLNSECGLSDEQREAARQHNIDLRLQIFRDIRRPGRDYTQLLEHLNLIKGDQDMKSDFIEMCISESMRFRRHQMVCSIQEWWESKQPHFEITKS